MLIRSALIFSFVVACEPVKESPADDTGDLPPFPTEGPCADAGWGYVSNAEAAIHVRSDGDDEQGTGSVDAPFLTLQAALDEVRKSESSAIALGPGEFDAFLDLNLVVPGSEASDNGLFLEGCGPEETVLLAADEDEPLLRIKGATDVRLAGFAMEGGTRALWIWGEAQVVVQSVTIDRSARVGVSITQPGTVVDLADVHITDVKKVSGATGVSVGYGIGVTDATANLSECSISGATTVGILGAGASLSLTGVTVQDTLQDDNEQFGRGIQLQKGEGPSNAELVNCNLLDNADAALFSNLSSSVSMDGLIVENVAAAELGLTGDDSSGDGVVISGVEDGSNYDPAAFQASLLNSEIRGSARAGALFERATVVMSDMVFENNGIWSTTGVHAVSQDLAEISGTSEILDLGTSPLLVNRVLVEVDQLGE